MASSNSDLYDAHHRPQPCRAVGLSFVKHFELAMPVNAGIVSQSGIAIGDVDNDECGDSEIVLATAEGHLAIYKGCADRWGSASYVNDSSTIANAVSALTSIPTDSGQREDSVTSGVLQPCFTTSNLGAVTALAIADVHNRGLNSLLVVCAESVCYVLDYQAAPPAGARISTPTRGSVLSFKPPNPLSPVTAASTSCLLYTSDAAYE